MTAPPDAVICAGRVYCDLVFTGAPALPSLGTETFADGLTLHGGGGALITAASFVAEGRDAALLATLPAPPFEDILRRDITRTGVDASKCRSAAPGAAPQLTIAMAQGADRAFLSHKSGPALPDPDFSGGRWCHLHIGELASLIEHPDLIARARAAGMSISLDCGWDADLLARGAALAARIAAVDVFLPNMAEYAQLCRSGLTENTAPVTVVKCGAAGARARIRNGAWIDQATDPAPVTDATGAGDAFNGSFLNAWLDAAPIDTCLARGNRAGGRAVQSPGGLAHLHPGKAQ